MKLSIIGPAYQDKISNINNQRCVNMYPSSAGVSGRGEEVVKDTTATLVPTAGLSLLTDLTGVEVRSVAAIGSYVYAVVDAIVYKLTVNRATETVETTTTLGTLDTSTGTVKVASNPTQIVWVDGSATGYIYTPGTGVFATINSLDADFPGATNIAFLDSYFVVSEPNTGKIYTSAGNDGASWDPADVATAESGTDNIVALAVSKGELWVLGERTTEIWYDAGNATGIPLSPRTGLELQIGCGAANSVVQLDDLIIWLDNRGYIVQSNVSPFVRNNNSGYDIKIVSTESLSADILSYSTTSDAIAFAYNDRGHLMYQITFPTARKTWVYDYILKVWHERTWYNEIEDREEHHLVQYYTQYGNLHLGAGIRNGKIYLMKPDVYTDNGVAIRRRRTTSPLYDPNQSSVLSVDSVTVKVATPKIAQSIEPQIMLRYSTDGGHTWSNELMRSIGKVGEYAKRITWNRLGTGIEWVFEFVITDAFSFSILDAFLQTEAAEEH